MRGFVSHALTNTRLLKHPFIFALLIGEIELMFSCIQYVCLMFIGCFRFIFLKLLVHVLSSLISNFLKNNFYWSIDALQCCVILVSAVQQIEPVIHIPTLLESIPI